MLIALVAVFSHSTAQTVKLFRDGNSEEVEVKAVHDSGIYDGLSWITVFDSLQIVKPGPYNAAIYGMLEKKFRQDRLSLEAQAGFGDVTVNVFDQFDQHRSTGKMLQMLGVATVSAGVFMIMQQNNRALDAIKEGKVYEPKKLPSGMVIGGAFLFGVGIAIDIGASSHLKKLRRH